MAAVVWTPAQSKFEIGTIVLKRRPETELTRDHYEGALGSRINRMARKVDPKQMWEVVQPAMINEGLDLTETNNPGDVLVENSDQLRNLSGMDAEKWPVSASQLQENQTEADRLINRDLALSDLMDLLYGE